MSHVYYRHTVLSPSLCSVPQGRVRKEVLTSYVSLPEDKASIYRMGEGSVAQWYNIYLTTEWERKVCVCSFSEVLPFGLIMPPGRAIY